MRERVQRLYPQRGPPTSWPRRREYRGGSPPIAGEAQAPRCGAPRACRGVISLCQRHSLHFCDRPGARITMSDAISQWRFKGVRIIRADELDANTAQTLGMHRRAAVTTERTGATKLWAGTVTINAKAKTGPHHHGDLESVIYVVSRHRTLALGRSARIRRRGRGRRFHLRSALRSAPGDQCQRGPAASLCAGTQRAKRAWCTTWISCRWRRPRRYAGSTICTNSRLETHRE
jgi:hypothetical protein